MYKRVCLVCGNDDKNKIVYTSDGYEKCIHCGESLIDTIEIEDNAISNDVDLLISRLQEESQYIF